MRILYVTPSNIRAGSSIALLSIIRGMKALGHEVAVVTVNIPDYFTEEVEKDHIPCFKTNTFLTVYPLVKNPIKYVPRLFYMLYKQYNGEKAVENAIRSFHPDIVHTNVGPFAIGFEAAKKMGIPHVWHQREFMDQVGMQFFPTYSSFLKKINSPGNYNICITEDLFRHLHLRKGNDRVIYDGVFSESIVSALPERHPEHNILFVGRIEEVKGLYDLLEAFLDFHKLYPDYKLQIIGETPCASIGYEKKCRKFISDNSLQNSVLFLGRQSNIYEYMSRATMTVVPSYFEGFGFVPVEAMLCGCPVIGRDTTGIREQMDNGSRKASHEIGFLFQNQKKLLQSMIQIVTTDTSRMCLDARKTVLKLYTIERNVHEIEKYYQQILADKKTGKL